MHSEEHSFFSFFLSHIVFFFPSFWDFTPFSSCKCEGSILESVRIVTSFQVLQNQLSMDCMCSVLKQELTDSTPLLVLHIIKFFLWLFTSQIQMLTWMHFKLSVVTKNRQATGKPSMSKHFTTCFRWAETYSFSKTGRDQAFCYICIYMCTVRWTGMSWLHFPFHRIHFTLCSQSLLLPTDSGVQPKCFTPTLSSCSWQIIAGKESSFPSPEQESGAGHCWVKEGQWLSPVSQKAGEMLLYSEFYNLKMWFPTASHRADF